MITYDGNAFVCRVFDLADGTWGAMSDGSTITRAAYCRSPQTRSQPSRHRQ